jgi:hypothetical protein
MNPNDLLLLTIPAAMAAFKLGFIAFAVVMLARVVWQPQIRLSPRPIAPSHTPRGSRGSRA